MESQSNGVASWLFGDKVRDVRKVLGWSQADLAKRINVTRGYLSLVERGLRTPSESVAGRIFRALVATILPPHSSVQGTFWEIDKEGYLVFGLRLAGEQKPVAWRAWRAAPDDSDVWGAVELKHYINLYAAILIAVLEHLEKESAERLEPTAIPRPFECTVVNVSFSRDEVELIRRMQAETGRSVRDFVAESIRRILSSEEEQKKFIQELAQEMSSRDQASGDR